ncbi:MAG: methyltransferase domain-containing protein [Pseudonocardiaceae bacterium]
MVAEFEWRQALGEVPRKPFIPETIWVENEQADGYVAVCRSQNLRRWEELVTADDAIVTQVDDGGTVPGSLGRSPSSSASKPSIVANMLRALDVHPGHAVLEIGTGTGWNAALLSKRVGQTGRVVSVEIDAELALAARTALQRGGYRASVITADGVAGYPPGAPYDRIISTAAVRGTVPGTWVRQTRPGGLIVTPWGTSYHNGTQLRLRVTDHNTATGRFGGNLAFMRLRTQRGPTWVDNENLDDADSRKTTLSSPEIGQAVASFDGSFAIGLHMPDCRVHLDEDTEDGQHLVWLSDGQSLARVVVEIGAGSHQVHQRGPRRLWDEVESAYRWWRDADKPEHTRFGVTITPHDQVMWLDNPTHSLPTQ